MTLHIDRRHFATSALMTPVALMAHNAVAQTPPAASPATLSDSSVGLTSTLEEWTAAAGEGTPIGEMGTIFTFISPIDGITNVTVGFTNEMASFMEYTFADATIGQEDAHAMVAGSIPTESMPGEQFLLNSWQDESSPFTAQLYTMPSSPESAIVSVMALGALEAEEAQVESISLCLSSPNPSDYAATGDPGGIGLTRDEVIGIYGEPADAIGEFELYPGSGPDGMDLATRYGSDGEALKAIQVDSPADAPVATNRDTSMAFVQGSVPPDAEVSHSFYLPSTEDGPLALDTVVWHSPELSERLGYKGSILSMSFILETNEGHQIQRIDLALNQDYA